MGDGGKIMSFLDAAADEHGKACLAAAHDIGMIAEDG